MTKNRRFVSLVGHFWYFITLSHCLVGVRGRTLPVRPDERKRSCPLYWEKVGDVAAVAPSSFFIRCFWELTNICFEIFFYLLPFFSIVDLTEKDQSKSSNFSVFSFLVRC